MIFIDDGSDDGTGIEVQKYVRERKIAEGKVMIVRNEVRLMAMESIRKTVNSYCKKWEITIIVDGDDQIIGRHVFKLINGMFQKYDVWITYTNHIKFN